MTQLVRFRASNLCGACKRGIYNYTCNIEREAFNNATLKAFDDGHKAEPIILKWAAENLDNGPYKIGYSNGSIGEICTDISLITGHVDGLGHSVKSQKRYVFEVKNLSPLRLDDLRKFGVKGAEPSYYTQVQLYMHGFLLKGLDYDECMWIAHNRKARGESSPSDYYSECITYDKYTVRDALEKADYIALHVLAKKEIPPDYNPFVRFFCNPGWCQYSNNCREYWDKHYGRLSCANP